MFCHVVLLKRNDPLRGAGSGCFRFKMDSFEEELADTVRKYSHLYDSSSADYKDIQKSRNSWREIAQSLGTEESICRKRWRGLRDRFAKAKRRMLCRTEDPNGNSVVIVPPLFISLQWLDSHVKRREVMTASLMSEPHLEVCVAQLLLALLFLA